MWMTCQIANVLQKIPQTRWTSFQKTGSQFNLSDHFFNLNAYKIELNKNEFNLKHIEAGTRLKSDEIKQIINHQSAR